MKGTRTIGYIAFVLTVAAVALLLVPAGNGQQPGQTAQRDFLGRPVVLPQAAAQRIVSLSPANTEILFALGAGERVVGVTDYCNYPAEARSKPKIGGFQNPDVEKIIALAPDVVIAGGGIQAREIRVLEKAGIPVVAVDPHTVADVLTAVDLIGAAVGDPAAGQRLHGRLAAGLRDVPGPAGAGPSCRVFIEVWDTPYMTVGGASYLNDVVRRAGGQNVFAGRPGDYVPADFETLYAANPDIYLIIGHGNPARRDEVLANPQLQEIPAIRAGRVYYLDDDIYLRPGPRSVESLARVAAVLQSGSRNLAVR